MSVVSQCKPFWLRAKETQISAALWALSLGKDVTCRNLLRMFKVHPKISLTQVEL